MFSPGALLFAAASGAGASGATIDSASHSLDTLGSECPMAGNLDVTYTASGVGGGDSVRVTRLIDGVPDSVMYEGSLQASETLELTWGMKAGTTSVTLTVRVEAIRSGDVTSARTSTGSAHSIDTGSVCPE